MKRNLLFILIILLPLALFSSYNFTLVVKYPFLSTYEQIDTVTSWYKRDSLARGVPLKTILYGYKGEYIEKEGRTDSKGSVYFSFKYWGNGEVINPEEIERMDIKFPDASILGVDSTFHPLTAEDIRFKRAPGGTLTYVLPSGTVHHPEINIGTSGEPIFFEMALMTDVHIGDGGWNFEGGSYNDAWEGTYGDGVIREHINNVIAMREYINNFCSSWGEYVPFVLITGDITDSDERAELECARYILDSLEVPYIPLPGNHDTWPYYYEGVRDPERKGSGFDS